MSAFAPLFGALQTSNAHRIESNHSCVISGDGDTMGTEVPGRLGA